MELFSVLKSNELFKGLSDDEVNKIKAICDKKLFKAGSIVFKENSKGTGMYILIKGKVDIQMSIGIDEEPVTVNVIKEGEVFGELSLVDKAPRSATARAGTEATAYVLEADRFEELIKENAGIGLVVMRNIARIVSSRLRKTNIKYTESLIWERLDSAINGQGEGDV